MDNFWIVSKKMLLESNLNYTNIYRNLMTINFHSGTNQIYILLENTITYFTISTQTMSGNYFLITGFMRTFGYFLAQDQ